MNGFSCYDDRGYALNYEVKNRCADLLAILMEQM